MLCAKRDAAPRRRAFGTTAADGAQNGADVHAVPLRVAGFRIRERLRTRFPLTDAKELDVMDGYIDIMTTGCAWPHWTYVERFNRDNKDTSEEKDKRELYNKELAIGPNTTLLSRRRKLADHEWEQVCEHMMLYMLDRRLGLYMMRRCSPAWDRLEEELIDLLWDWVPHLARWRGTRGERTEEWEDELPPLRVPPLTMVRQRSLDGWSVGEVKELLRIFTDEENLSRVQQKLRTEDPEQYVQKEILLSDEDWALVCSGFDAEDLAVCVPRTVTVTVGEQIEPPEEPSAFRRRWARYVVDERTNPFTHAMRLADHRQGERMKMKYGKSEGVNLYGAALGSPKWKRREVEVRIRYE